MVGIQGIEGSYSHRAVQLLLGKEVKWFPYRSFVECFSGLKSGKVDSILVPFENRITGIIPEVAELLFEHQVIFTQEISLPLDHTLLSKVPTTIEKISKIFSHPQAIAQCSNYLKKLKNVEIIPVYDTAGAVEYLGNSDSFAIIAGAHVKKLFHLHTVETNIQDREDNATRFVFINHQLSEQTSFTKLTLLSAINEGEVLSAILRQFGLYSFRSEKIDSNLSPLYFREYQFDTPQFYKNTKELILQNSHRGLIICGVTT